jgi:hypothetical protein
MTDTATVGEIVERLRAEHSLNVGWSANEAANLIEKLVEALRPFAERPTMDEIMQGKAPDHWINATGERRIEMLGERKRENDAAILNARQLLNDQSTKGGDA